VPEELTGVVIEKLSRRKGNMLEMNPEHGGVSLIFEIPSRGLLGYKNTFIVDTRGEGILYSRVIGFRPHVGPIPRRHVGSMVSMATGKALGFSLFNLQNRGALYVGANVDVYEGMVIGNTSKGDDMTVNPIKGKQLSNMRSSGADEAIRLTTPLEMTIEKGMSVMSDDEYLEITPQSVRLRKQFLNETERVRAARSKS